MVEAMLGRRAGAGLHPHAAGRRADSPLRAGAARGAALAAGRPGPRLSRRLPAESNAARSSRICSAASCAAWPPPTRWSWASTSARSTWPCWSDIPARSPAPGSRPAAAAGGTTKAWPCCWPATIRSISTCCGIPIISSRSRRNTRSSIPTIRTCWPSTCQSAAFELPLAEADVDRFGPLAVPIAGVLCDGGQLSEVGGQYYFAGGQNPAARISLRHMSDNTFSIVLRRSRQAARQVAELSSTRSSPTSTRSAPRSSSIPRPSTCTTAKRTSSASSTSSARSPTSNGARWTTTRRPCSKAASSSRASDKSGPASPRRCSPTATSTSPGKPSPSRRSNSPRAKTSASARSTFRRKSCKPPACGCRPTTRSRGG